MTSNNSNNYEIYSRRNPNARRGNRHQPPRYDSRRQPPRYDIRQQSSHQQYNRGQQQTQRNNCQQSSHQQYNRGQQQTQRNNCQQFPRSNSRQQHRRCRYGGECRSLQGIGKCNFNHPICTFGDNCRSKHGGTCKFVHLTKPANNVPNVIPVVSNVILLVRKSQKRWKTPIYSSSVEAQTKKQFPATVLVYSKENQNCAILKSAIDFVEKYIFDIITKIMNEEDIRAFAGFGADEDRMGFIDAYRDLVDKDEYFKTIYDTISKIEDVVIREDNPVSSLVFIIDSLFRNTKYSEAKFRSLHDAWKKYI